MKCEGVNLRDIAASCGTPAYVYSKQSVIDHCRWIENVFEGIDHLSCYAVKANSNKDILRLLAHQGIGADVGSMGEMHRALEAGFSSEKITFSGVGKRDDEIEFALRNNIMSLNVESEEEITVIGEIARGLKTRARILLRVNFDIASETHPYITTGTRKNKFGVSQALAKDILLRAVRQPYIDILGIHSHIGSQITQPSTFVAAAQAIVQLVHELRSAAIPISQVNFGGGFGVQYRDYVRHSLLPVEPENSEANVTTVNLLSAVLPTLRQANCKLLIQPGRSIVAHAGILLTKVLYRKKGEGKTFIIVDAGMNDLIRPSLYQSYHQVVPLFLRNVPHEMVDVVGPLCETGDFFALDRSMPKVERGDYLAVMCAGAYGYVLSSNYNGRPRPAEVMVDGNQFQIITERESIQEL
ncbi:MAG: diaminopimelate decarboxylase [Ignavibacteria bacterium]|nr:diaminopimelate decarboxylase [Ignavibacteria bacterium]